MLCHGECMASRQVAFGDRDGMHRVGKGESLALRSALQALISVSGEESMCQAGGDGGQAGQEMGNPKPGLWE